MAELITVVVAVLSLAWAQAMAFWLSRLLYVRPLVAVPLALLPLFVVAMLFVFQFNPALRPVLITGDRAAVFLVAAVAVPLPILLSLLIAPLRRLRAGLPNKVEEVFQ